jgi:hypothetical protein
VLSFAVVADLDTIGLGNGIRILDLDANGRTSSLTVYLEVNAASSLTIHVGESHLFLEIDV